MNKAAKTTPNKGQICYTLWFDFFLYTDLFSLSAKPGVCPLMKYIRADCTESCSKDSDCPDNEKCCSNGCGHECMPPVIGEK
uniref:WAP domain-containing protein n=1 Tax=Oreochromis niloticus TaxID=8128 RepID=I3J1M3_ORENI